MRSRRIPTLTGSTTRGRAALAALAAAALSAWTPPAGAAGVSLPCAFEPGAKVGYRVERAREDVRGGRTTGGRGAYDVDVEVTGREAGGYLLRWRQGAAAVGSTTPLPPAAQAEIDAVVGAAEGLELAIRTDAKMTPRSLANETEVRAVFEATLERLQALDGAPSEARDATRRLLATPGTLAALALREPQLLFMLACAELEGDRVEYADRLPNPFGGAPLPSRAVVTVLSQGGAAADAPARLRFAQTLDPVAVRTFLEDFARRAAPGREPPPGAVPSFAIDDEATVEVDTADGWPTRVDWSRRVTAGEARRTDSLTFTRTTGR